MQRAAGSARMLGCRMKTTTAFGFRARDAGQVSGRRREAGETSTVGKCLREQIVREFVLGILLVAPQEF